MGFGFVSGQLSEVRQSNASLLNATVVNPNYGSFLSNVRVIRTLPLSNIHGGQLTSTTPGTAVTLGTAHCDAVVVKGLTSNAGIAYVGDSNLKKNQFELNAKEAVALGVGNLGSVFIDVDNSGEGVSYLYVK